jgi:mevalonate kinase
MKKLLFAVAVLITATFATLRASDMSNNSVAENECNTLSATETESSGCDYELWTYNGDIRYTNKCDCAIKLKIYYSYRSYRNQNVNGKMTPVWSDWKSGSTERWISAHTGNGTVISGMSNEEYHLESFKYLSDNCD